MNPRTEEVWEEAVSFFVSACFFPKFRENLVQTHEFSFHTQDLSIRTGCRHNKFKVVCTKCVVTNCVVFVCVCVCVCV